MVIETQQIPIVVDNNRSTGSTSGMGNSMCSNTAVPEPTLVDDKDEDDNSMVQANEDVGTNDNDNSSGNRAAVRVEGYCKHTTKGPIQLELDDSTAD